MVSSGNVAIFWDFENCRPPSSVSGYFIADKIRRIASPFGAIILFKAYLELNSDFLSGRSYVLQSELQSSGISLTHTPHNGRKDVADKMMIVDMLAFAIDHCAPATFILITGDRDFAYAAAILRLRGYEVIVVLPSTASHVSLRVQASILFQWQRDVLGNRSSTHTSNEDASGQQECTSGAVSSETSTISPSTVISTGNNISAAFEPAKPTMPHSELSSSTTLQSPSSDTNENNVDITSSAILVPPSFAGNPPLEANFRCSCDCCGKHTSASEVGKHCTSEFERDKNINDDNTRTRTRTLLPDPMRQLVSAMQPLEASFGQHAASCILVEDSPSNNTELVESESQIGPHVVNVIAMVTEDEEHVPLSYQPCFDQINHEEAGIGGSPRDGDGAVRRRPSLSGAAPLPLASSPRNALASDTTGINVTADLTVMGKPGVLLRECDVDAVIAVLPASRDKEFNNRNSPTPLADSHDVDTSSGEFSGSSCDVPLLHPSPASPRPSSSHSQGTNSIVKAHTSNTQSAPTTPCGSQNHTTPTPSATLECSQPSSQSSSVSSRSSSLSGSLGTCSSEQDVDRRFSALVECFRASRSKDGRTSIRSSELGAMLLKQEPLVYMLAGVPRLKDYLNLARLEGIVISPGLDKSGDAGVEINPRLYAFGLSSRVEVVQTQSSFNAPPLISLPPLVAVTNSMTVNPVFSTQSSSANPIPEPFIPLVLLLRQLSPSTGRILFSLLGASIRQKYPAVYERAGVSGLRPYLERARSMGIVTLGALDTQGKQWVQLSNTHQAA